MNQGWAAMDAETVGEDSGDLGVASRVSLNSSADPLITVTKALESNLRKLGYTLLSSRAQSVMVAEV